MTRSAHAHSFASQHLQDEISVAPAKNSLSVSLVLAIPLTTWLALWAPHRLSTHRPSMTLSVGPLHAKHFHVYHVLDLRRLACESSSNSSLHFPSSSSFKKMPEHPCRQRSGSCSSFFCDDDQKREEAQQSCCSCYNLQVNRSTLRTFLCSLQLSLSGSSTRIHTRFHPS